MDEEDQSMRPNECSDRGSTYDSSNEQCYGEECHDEHPRLICRCLVQEDERVDESVEMRNETT